MSEHEIIERVTAWVEVVKKYNDLTRQLSKLLGGWIDSPLVEAVEKIISEYQKSLSAETGIHKDALSWFRFENKFGADAEECEMDGEVFIIDSVEAFVKFEKGAQ